jgi:hypothetical protein
MVRFFGGCTPLRFAAFFPRYLTHSNVLTLSSNTDRYLAATFSGAVQVITMYLFCGPGNK